MFDIFFQIKPYINPGPDFADNIIFKLHYKVTFLILVTCSLLVTARQYIGDPIDCIIDTIPPSAIDTYCWIHTTFSVFGEAGWKNADMPHGGVAPVAREDIRHHKYYQWVCFTLFLQALIFTVPKALWHQWEGGLITMLVQGLQAPLQEKDKRRDQIQLLLKYFSKSRREHNVYIAKLIFCETLNLINVLGQIYFMDYFLGGHFASYGMDVLALTEQDARSRADPMAQLFPKMTKCIFRKFGPSGTVEKLDALCVMPLNNVNEKIYVFLWFYFIVVAVASAGQLFCRILMATVPRLRSFLLQARVRLAGPDDVAAVCQFANFGDWIVLYQLGKNLDPLAGRDFLCQLGQLPHVKGKGKVDKEAKPASRETITAF